MRNDKVRQAAQATYRDAHRARARRRREPTGRDVAAALLDLYLDGAARQPDARHGALVSRLIAKGFDGDASADFVRRMIRRVREAADGHEGGANVDTVRTYANGKIS